MTRRDDRRYGQNHDHGQGRQRTTGEHRVFDGSGHAGQNNGQGGNGQGDESEMPALNVQQELHDIRREMTLMRQEMKDILEAWRTANGLLKFVKLIGSAAIAVTAIWALIKIGFDAMLPDAMKHKP